MVLALQGAAQDFKIEGTLSAVKSVDKVFLNYRGDEVSVRDSVQPKNGRFVFKGKIAEPLVATLQLRYLAQPGEEKPKWESVQIFLEPTTLSIIARDSLKNHKVSGSKGQADFEKIKTAVAAYDPALQKLYADYGTARKANNKEEMQKIESEIEAIDAEIKETVYVRFLQTNAASPVALYALQQYAGWNIDPDKVEPLFNALPARQQKRPSAVALKERIDIAQKTAIGKQAMDFTQEDTLGRPVSLSSFQGKYVLVDFWASWCGPCRAENPNVVKAFNQYKDKGFTVLGVSLDRPNAKDKWLKAIHDDNLTWTHVSDLKYWDNEVAKQYGIRAIPQNLLIDPQGKIVAKNVAGEGLQQKLAEIFK